MLKCRDMAELATDYMEGALPLRLRLAARWHLHLCGMCRNYLDQLGKSVRLVRGQSMGGAAPEVETRLTHGKAPE